MHPKVIILRTKMFYFSVEAQPLHHAPYSLDAYGTRPSLMKSYIRHCTRQGRIQEFSKGEAGTAVDEFFFTSRLLYVSFTSFLVNWKGFSFSDFLGWQFSSLQMERHDNVSTKKCISVYFNDTIPRHKIVITCNEITPSPLINAWSISLCLALQEAFILSILKCMFYSRSSCYSSTI